MPFKMEAVATNAKIHQILEKPCRIARESRSSIYRIAIASSIDRIRVD